MAESRARSALRVVRDTARFIGEVRRGRFDLVHLNPSLLPKAAVRDATLLLLAKALGKRTVVMTHGWDEMFERRLASRYRWLSRLALNRADAFIVLGKVFAARLRALGYRGRVFIHPVPLEEELLRDAARHSTESRGRAGDGSFTILFLARIEREKGIYEALEAYGTLKARYPFLRMIVAGDGRSLHDVRRACELKDISFPGRVEGKTKYAAFRMADAYLFPSYREGLPISVLEAMAYGLPVVTTRVGALPDFFRHGEMGFMTPSSDPNQLAALMEELIVDPMLARRIGSFNSQYATEHFAGARIAAGLEDIYAAVLDGTD